jgi:hypothetical protein
MLEAFVLLKMKRVTPLQAVLGAFAIVKNDTPCKFHSVQDFSG